MLKNIIEDLDIYAYRKGWPKWSVLFIPIFYWTTWPIISYRFSHWVHYRVNILFFRQVLKCFSFMSQRFFETFTSVEISEKAFIGKGIFIAHYGSIVISERTRIGDYVSLHQGVTLGGAGRGEDYGDPVLGDRVYIGAGAKVVGKVNLGSDIMIGCNSVVTKNFPDSTTLGGVPAKILNYDGSVGFIHYRNQKNHNLDLCKIQ
ncbi:serine O-acetyltransferase [Pontibacter fetidus]|uniref:Serine acetyltransferase n=1 Tax=Pontibacter fetidus TaxID=2700082 RepID=A0A6B2HAU5_9BACT|nr:serine acetyltransferase [Pontibacter fetidus]NDK57510.1 serine acetyltransferase [Pontibacter fetidus]